MKITKLLPVIIILLICIIVFTDIYENFVGCYSIHTGKKINDDTTCDSNHCYCFNGTVSDDSVCNGGTAEHCNSCNVGYIRINNLCLLQPHTNYTHIQDANCDIGYYKSREFCEPCTRCEDSGEVQISDCTITYDTQCEDPCIVYRILVDGYDVSTNYNDIYKKIILGNDGTNQQTYQVDFQNDMIIDILIVGGGGGGSGGKNNWAGGGGGGGGILYGTDIQVKSGTYTFKVGRGGTGEHSESGVLIYAEKGFASEALSGIAYGGNEGRGIINGKEHNYGGRGGKTSTAFTLVSPLKFNHHDGSRGGNPTYYTNLSENGIDGYEIDIIGSYYWGGGGGGGGRVTDEIGNGGKGGGGAGGFTGHNGTAIGGTGFNNGGNNTTLSSGTRTTAGAHGGALTGGGGGGAWAYDGGNGGSGSIIILYKCIESIFNNQCVNPDNLILVNDIDVSLPYDDVYKRIILRNKGSNQETYRVNFVNTMIINILIVGGGGGGAGGVRERYNVKEGGGGGGGGILHADNLEVTSGTYEFKVGKGGNCQKGPTLPEDGFQSKAFDAIAYGGNKGLSRVDGKDSQYYGGVGGTTDTSSATLSPTAFTGYDGGNGGSCLKYDKTGPHSASGVNGHEIDIVGPYFWGGGGGGGSWNNYRGNGGNGGGGAGAYVYTNSYDGAIGGTGINNGDTVYADIDGQPLVNGGNGGELTGGGGGGCVKEGSYGGNGGSGSIIILYKCTG